MFTKGNKNVRLYYVINRNAGMTMTVKLLESCKARFEVYIPVFWKSRCSHRIQRATDTVPGYSIVAYQEVKRTLGDSRSDRGRSELWKLHRTVADREAYL